MKIQISIMLLKKSLIEAIIELEKTPETQFYKYSYERGRVSGLKTALFFLDQEEFLKEIEQSPQDFGLKSDKST